MMMTSKSLKGLILDLHNVQAVKFGKFTLKSGLESPVYFDLRVTVSYPSILQDVANFLWESAGKNSCQFSLLCGVPYTALPIATCMSVDHGVPMLIRRKEAKDYGTKKMIEGNYQPGDTCLVVEDVVTSGSSVLETVQMLQKEGILVRDAVVLLDREQGGKQLLEKHGIKLHSVCTISQMLRILFEAEKLETATVRQVTKFIAENNTFSPAGTPSSPTKSKLETCTTDSTEKKLKADKTRSLRYEDRAAMCKHPVAGKLFTIMAKKKTNLCLSADVISTSRLLEVADSIGPYICLLKTHADTIDDFNLEFTQKLTSLAEKHDFLIFEDRKFADIGSTVKKQFASGLHKISDWADVVNAHALPGPGVLEGLKERLLPEHLAILDIGRSIKILSKAYILAVKVRAPKERACLLIAEMSSKGNLAKDDYIQSVVEMGKNHSDFVIGFICQRKLVEDPTYIHMTPGVQLIEGGDNLGQQYLTPEEVIGRRRSDVIIVGRGILQSADPVATAQLYQKTAFAVYDNFHQSL